MRDAEFEQAVVEFATLLRKHQARYQGASAACLDVMLRAASWFLVYARRGDGDRVRQTAEGEGCARAERGSGEPRECRGRSSAGCLHSKERGQA